MTVFGAQPASPDPGPEVVVETTVPLDGPEPAAPGSPTSPLGQVAKADREAASIAAASDPLDPGSPTLPADVVPSAGSLLVTLPWGSGDGEVGLVRPTEGLAHGPEALAIAPDGRIALLDSVNKRVLFLDSAGQYTGAVGVFLNEPRFLAVTDTRVYVLDCDADRRLVTLGWSGESYGSVALPALPDAVSGLFATAVGPCVEVAHDKVYRLTGAASVKTSASLADTGSGTSLDPAQVSLPSLSGRPADSACTRLVKVSYAPGGDPRATSFLTQDGVVAGSTSSLRLVIPSGRSIEHLVSVDGDAADALIVGARLTDVASSDQSLLSLKRFALRADGMLLPASQVTGENDSLLLVDWSMAYVGQPYAVAPDGRVFQPVATDGGYAIFIHFFAAGVTTELTQGV
jgi:hypothetical protein